MPGRPRFTRPPSSSIRPAPRPGKAWVASAPRRLPPSPPLVRLRLRRRRPRPLLLAFPRFPPGPPRRGCRPCRRWVPPVRLKRLRAYLRPRSVLPACLPLQWAPRECLRLRSDPPACRRRPVDRWARLPCPRRRPVPRPRSARRPRPECRPAPVRRQAASRLRLRPKGECLRLRPVRRALPRVRRPRLLRDVDRPPPARRLAPASCILRPRCCTSIRLGPPRFASR